MSKLLYGWGGRVSKIGIDQEKMKKSLCSQNGTVILMLNVDLLFDKTLKYVDFFKNTSGGHIYFLRKEEKYLRFYYMSLGSKETKMAEILISKINKKDSGACILSWSGGNNELKIPYEETFTKSIGEPSSIYLKEHNGEIIPIRGEDKQYLRIYHSNEASEPSAINIWNEIIEGVKNLNYNYKEKKYEIFSINQSINSIITGFESYLKTRFLELEKEGVNIDKNYLFEKYGESQIKDLLSKNLLNFQNYKDAKTLYGKVYKIKFDKLVNSQEINKIKTIIGYRHLLTHVTPFLPVLNRKDYIKGEKAIEPTKELLMDILKSFTKFVEIVHLKSLYLDKNEIEFKEVKKQDEISKKIQEILILENKSIKKNKLEKLLKKYKNYSDKNKGHLYFNLGYLESKNSKDKKAVEYYKKLVALNIPSDQKRTGYYNLISILIKSKEFKLASEYVKEIKEIRGLSEIVSMLEAGILYKSKKKDQAIEKYKEVLEILPYSKGANVSLGNIYIGKKEFTLAIEHYNKIEEIEKEESMIYSQRGIAYLMLKEYEKALKDLKRAIELEETSKNFMHKGLAETYAEKLDMALESYNKSIELDPSYAYTYLNKANVLYLQNKIKEAKENIQKAIELDPNDSQIIYNYNLIQRCSEKPINRKVVSIIKNINLS